MKNIAIENLVDQITHGTGHRIYWRQMVQVSRTEAGLSTYTGHISRFSVDDKVSKEKMKQELIRRGYILSESRKGIEAYLLREDEKCINTFVDFDLGLYHANTAQIDYTGDPEECKSIREWFKQTFDTKGFVITTATDIDKNGRLISDENFFQAESIKKPHQSFYPWLSVSLEEYYKAFMESEESILVMFGPPGTGKTTFLRGLFASGNYDSMLAYNKDVIESPSLLRHFYNDSDKRILAYEDIDKHLGRREDDNMLMSSLLNAADGVVERKNKKLVFVTNLPSINRIDSALLRAGRCFDILEFRELTQDEATTVRSDMNMDSMDYTSKKSWALAEVLAKHAEARQVVNRFGRRAGFTT